MPATFFDLSSASELTFAGMRRPLALSLVFKGLGKAHLGLFTVLSFRE